MIRVAFEPGTVFAGYTIERVLGSGGAGVVYLARHPNLPVRNALKVLADSVGDDPGYRARFEREARLASQLQHPNIVTVYDTGAVAGLLWMSMHYVDGVSVARLVELGPAQLTPARAVEIVRQAALGIDKAHRAGLIHRDIKPANLLVQPDDDLGERVFVADFGIARRIDQTDKITRDDQLVATLPYAAPEQIEGARLDQRSDVYALGVTLYEMLTGATPFDGDTMATLIRRKFVEPPASVTARNPSLPPAIDAVLAIAMARDPADRYPTCSAFAADAAAALNSPVPTSSPPITSRVFDTAPEIEHSARDHRGGWAVAGGLALAGLVAAGALVGLRPGGANEIVGATTTPPTTRGTSTTAATGHGQAPRTWDQYAFVAAAFPNLVPASPDGTGYLGARCGAVDADGKQIGLETTPPDSVLNCYSYTGTESFLMKLSCNRDRTRRSPTAPSGLADSQDERWSRPSGTGTVRYGTGTGTGILTVWFDDAARNFCLVMVGGGQTGRDVYDNWWHSAPL